MSIINFNFGANRKEKEELQAERERLEKMRLELEDLRATAATERAKTDADRRMMSAGKVLWTLLNDDLLLNPWLYSKDYTPWDRWSALMNAVELVNDVDCLDALKKHLLNKRIY